MYALRRKPPLIWPIVFKTPAAIKVAWRRGSPASVPSLDWLRDTHDWPGLKAVATVTAMRDGEPALTRLFLPCEVISVEAAAKAGSRAIGA
jgi:hypothetical protein